MENKLPSPRRQAAIVLLGSVAVTLAMLFLPSRENVAWLFAPFRWLQIYVHEFGHGIAALLAGGQFDHFEMYTFSGVALTHTSGALAQAFVCAGGLCGPALVGGIFLAMGRTSRGARIALGAFGAFMVASLVLWTRTPFGWVFGAVVAAVALGVALRLKRFAQPVLVFLGVQLALSVYTGGGYLFTQYVQIQNGYRGPSDTQVMADALGLPYFVWGMICAGFSLAVLALGLWLNLRSARTARRP
ncbi:MAG TPA: M50 family metallopeptidase [Kofleriaceae bacterium]